MEVNPQTTTASTNCRCCNANVTQADQFCQQCGYPLHGSVEQQDQYIYNRNFKHLELNQHHRKIDNAGITLYVLAGIFFVWGLVYFFMNSDNDAGTQLLITNAVLAVLFLLLGFWSKQKPVAVLISGIVLYGLVIIINVIEDPVSLVKGVIMKIIIIGYLIKGLTAAFEAEKIKRQHNI